MEHGFLRVAACSPHIEVADCDKNTQIIISESKKAAQNGAKTAIIEHTKRLGSKILSTGNGKCNFTNMDFHFHKN